MPDADRSSTVPRGRKRDPSSKSGKARELLATGMKPADVAAKLGCAPALIYNVRARMRGAEKRASPQLEPKRDAAASPATALDGLLAAVRETEQERVRLRAALERIHDILSDALR